jgi:hypothetical protein
MTVKTPYREAVDVLVDEGGETLQLCYQTSRTDKHCRGGQSGRRGEGESQQEYIRRLGYG